MMSYDLTSIKKARYNGWCIAWLLLLVWFVQSGFAFTVPAKPQGYVNDYAKILTPAQQTELDTRLKDFETKTSTQIFVAIFPSLDNETVEDASLAIAEQWKVGKKGRDNGVLLSIFIKEHKIRVEVGYGLEGVLTDALSGQIIRNEMAPAFLKQQYFDGLSNGLNAIMAATKNEYTATNSSAATAAATASKNKSDRDSSVKQRLSLTTILIILGLLIVLAYLNRLSGLMGGGNSRIQGKNNHRNGGGFGGGGFGSGGGGFGGGGGGGFGGGGASGGW